MNNIELVKALHHIWNTGDLALIDSVYAQDFVAHWPASSEVPERRGVEGIHFGVGRVRTAFPDWHEQVVDVFGSGDRVASRYVSTGTHKGVFWGIEPTGRHIEIQEMSIFRIADGRIIDAMVHVRRSGKAATTGCQPGISAQDIEALKSLPLIRKKRPR
jgi:predicted ester cyclase